jgi:hypothetical protein
VASFSCLRPAWLHIGGRRSGPWFTVLSQQVARSEVYSSVSWAAICLLSQMSKTYTVTYHSYHVESSLPDRGVQMGCQDGWVRNVSLSDSDQHRHATTTSTKKAWLDAGTSSFQRSCIHPVRDRHVACYDGYDYLLCACFCHCNG